MRNYHARVGGPHILNIKNKSLQEKTSAKNDIFSGELVQIWTKNELYLYTYKSFSQGDKESIQIYLFFVSDLIYSIRLEISVVRWSRKLIPSARRMESVEFPYLFDHEKLNFNEYNPEKRWQDYVCFLRN